MIDVSLYRLRLILIVIGLVLLIESPSRRAEAEDPIVGTAQTMDPRPLGAAGAMIAAPGGINGVYLNPATIAMASLYHIEGMYQFTSRENMHMGGIAVVDSVTLPNVAAGASFNYSGCNSNRTAHDSFDVRLSVAGAIGDMLYLGVTGRYLQVKQNLSSSKWGPSGRPALPFSGSKQMNGFTVDAALGLRLAEIVTIGVVGYNLTHTKSAFAPIELGSGVSVSLMDMLSIEADVLVDFTGHDDTAVELRAGGELLLGGSFFLRGGYKYDFYYERNLIAAGLGYAHTSFGIDFGFSQEIIKEGQTIAALSFQYFVP